MFGCAAKMPKRKRAKAESTEEDLASKVARACGGELADDKVVGNADSDTDSENEYWHPVQVEAREKKKWDDAVDQLRKAEHGKGRAEVTSSEPERTEWSQHLTQEGDRYFWHSENTGSTWQDPTQPVVLEDGTEYVMVVIPDRAVPGMLLCIDVPAREEAPGAVFCRCWTPMKVPEGARPGAVFRVKLGSRPAPDVASSKTAATSS